MKEWKIRQQMYDRTWHDHDDLINYLSYVDTSELGFDPSFAGQIGSYFMWQWEILIYPEKSYAVAMVYAKLLEKYFGENFYEVLDDQDLLLGDKFFVRYSHNKTVYDTLIGIVTKYDKWDFENSQIPQVLATVDYFKTEFSVA